MGRCYVSGVEWVCIVGSDLRAHVMHLHADGSS